MMVWDQITRALGMFEHVEQIRKAAQAQHSGGDKVCFRCIKTVVLCASLVVCRRSDVCWVASSNLV